MKLQFKNETRKLGDLRGYYQNPRTLSKKMYKKLVNSLKEFDLAEVPVINLDDTIIAGHQRVAVLIGLYGNDHIIDVRVPNRSLTEVEVRKYLLISNKISGSFDNDKLANWFDSEELMMGGFEMSDFGLEEQESSQGSEPKLCPNCGVNLND